MILKTQTLILAVALILAVHAFAADKTPEATEEASTPVARVGDQVITSDEFQRDMALRMRQIERERGAKVDPDIKFRLAILNELINGKVLALLAENSSISVPAAEVNAEFERRKKSMPSEAAYQEYLSREGLTEEKLRELLIRRIRTRKFVEEKTKNIAISDDEVKAEYERWLKEGKLDRETKTADFAHIIIRPEADNSDAWNAAKQQIEAARNRVLAGEAFEDVAQDVSQDIVSAARGGTYFEATPEVVAPEFAEKLFALPLGEVSEPFRSQAGWHIMKVTQHNEPGKVSYEKVKEELRDNLADAAHQKRIADLVKGARVVLDIEIFKTQHFSGDESLDSEEANPQPPAGEQDGPKS